MENNMEIQLQEQFSNAGVFIDIDGVVLKGGKPFDFSKEAIHKLWNNKIPFMFVTNGTYSSEVLVNSLRGILELPFTDDHVVVAPSPCLELTEYHNKRVLVCCQDDAINLITELGFNDYITLPELSKIFPELDYVDHNKRKELMHLDQAQIERLQAEFRPIEAILLLGEPVNWEMALQLLLDILMTNGDPRNKFKYVPHPHLPLIAANKDLTFKGAANLPRFGHGAFLTCLEQLYLEITKNELNYEFLMGKPFLITYDFAANKIQRQSKNGQPITKFYIIGDNPEVDIKGANTFKEQLESLENKSNRTSNRSSAKSSRRSSFTLELSPFDQMTTSFRSNKNVESILVCTGVYQKQCDLMFHLNTLFNEKIKSPALSKETSQNDIVNQNGYSEGNCNIIVTKCETEEDLKIETNELRSLLSRRNSFITYFENKLNIPDLTFDNLKDAVDYIVKNEIF